MVIQLGQQQTLRDLEYGGTCIETKCLSFILGLTNSLIPFVAEQVGLCVLKYMYLGPVVRNTGKNTNVRIFCIQKILTFFSTKIKSVFDNEVAYT